MIVQRVFKKSLLNKYLFSDKVFNKFNSKLEKFWVDKNSKAEIESSKLFCEEEWV